jgi:transcriptional regulator with XRE-family HTH domain
MTTQTDQAWLDSLTSAEVARTEISGVDDDATVSAHLAAIAARPTWTMTYDWTHGAPSQGVVLRLVAALAVGRTDLEPSPAAQNLGAYIQEMREARDESREAFARRAGLHPVALILAERGLLTPAEFSDAFRSRAAIGLGVPMAFLHFVMNPSVEVVPPVPPVAVIPIATSIWDMIRSALAPAPTLLWGATLGAPAVSTTDAPEWVTGLRDKVIDAPVPLPTFESITEDDHAVTVTVLPELRPDEGREVGRAALHLRLVVDGESLVEYHVTLHVGDAPLSGTTDAQGCVAFPHVRIGRLLDAIDGLGEWPVVISN